MDPYTQYPNYIPFSAMTIHDNVPQWIIVHCSASDVDNFASIQNYHITAPDHLWSNCGYHAIIERDGTLHLGRPDLFHGSHCPEQQMNTHSLAICICGDLDKHTPNQMQIDTLKKYLIDKMTQYGIPKDKIVPHRYFNTTGKTCYGSKLSDAWAQELVAPIHQILNKDAIKAQIKALVDQL